MNPKKFGAITSSVDPDKISETVLGLAKTIAGILVFAGVMSVADSTTLLTTVPQLITDVLAMAPLAFAAWHSCVTIFGLLQKVLVAVFAKKN